MADATAELHIGDLVTFKNLKWNGFLCAEGILLEELHMSESVEIFDDSLFSVHLQRQYSAARELEEFIAANDIDKGTGAIIDPSKREQFF